MQLDPAPKVDCDLLKLEDRVGWRVLSLQYFF